MLSKVLKSIRRNKAINFITSHFFLGLNKLILGYQEKLLKRWQLAGEVTLKMNGVDIRVYTDCDDPIVNKLYFGFPWEQAERKAWAILCQNAQIVIDVGANTGMYTLLTQKLNPNAEVYAFEPYTPNLKRLKENLGLNQIITTKVIDKAVGNFSGDIEFYVPLVDKISHVASVVPNYTEIHLSLRELKTKQVVVAQLTLDDFVAQNQLTGIELIKLDVEYNEFNFLLGAINTLKRFKPVLLCEVHNYEVFITNIPGLKDKIPPDHTQRIQDLLLDLGYYFYFIGEDGLLRVSDLYSNLDWSPNYIFSPHKSVNIYLPYSQPEAIRQLII